MNLPELLAEVRKLSRVERLQMIEALVHDLKTEEVQQLTPQTAYPIYTPDYDFEAAQVLLDALEQATQDD